MYSGPSSVCSNLFYGQAGVHDAFFSKLAERSRALKVGNGFDDGTQIGPLINPAAVEKVEQHVADATAKGAVVLAGGHRHKLGGSFFEPTVLSGVTQDRLIAREETFGPEAGVIRFDAAADAIPLAKIRRE